MKLIYYGHFDRPSDCENWIADALTRAGVLVYRWQRKLGNSYSDWNDFVHFVRSERIQVCLFSKAPELSSAKLMELRRATGCKIVWWTFDWMAHPNVADWYFALARVSDLCFQTDGIDADGTYARMGIRRIELHQGADPTLHNRYSGEITAEDRQKYSADVAFFGSLYTPRRKALDNFLRATYGSSYKIWGGGDGFEQGLWNQEYRKAVKLSKVIVGDNFRNDIPGYWSDRVYLTLGCGGCFVTSYVPGLENVLDTGRDLLTWNDFSDLQVTINTLLERPIQREALAAHGYWTVRQNHTYDQRVLVFLEKVRELFT